MIWGRSPVFELETLNACPWPLAVSAGSHLGDIGSHGEPSHTHFMGREKPPSWLRNPPRFAHVCVDETDPSAAVATVLPRFAHVCVDETMTVSGAARHLMAFRPCVRG